ncbi:hypothetical protein Golomagni_08084 [Golovinomyces magnicellulatus]|nr:hypothetical protein Golomagni_08084 [Golovinomyces magnicellulatus]
MQERFRTAIANFDLITNTSARMLKAASILDVPVFTTEQNPKGASLLHHHTTQTHKILTAFSRHSPRRYSGSPERPRQAAARTVVQSSTPKDQVQHGPPRHHGRMAQERRRHQARRHLWHRIARLRAPDHARPAGTRHPGARHQGRRIQLQRRRDRRRPRGEPASDLLFSFCTLAC